MGTIWAAIENKVSVVRLRSLKSSLFSTTHKITLIVRTGLVQCNATPLNLRHSPPANATTIGMKYCALPDRIRKYPSEFHINIESDLKAQLMLVPPLLRSSEVKATVSNLPYNPNSNYSLTILLQRIVLKSPI